MRSASLNDSVSIVVPCRGVNELVKKCVTACQTCCPGAEIIVVCEEQDGTDWLDRAGVISIVSAVCSIGAMRNIGARYSSRAYLAFIDSDAFPSEGWTVNAVRRLEKDAHVWAVGGPNISPPSQSRSERYVGLAQLSVLVSGSYAYRKRVASERCCDGLPSCNLVVRRQQYLEMGGMNEQLYTGEDMEFCSRVRRRDKAILYAPEVMVHHKNRRLTSFVLQRITYGASALEVIRETRSVKTMYLLLPAMLMCFFGSGIITLFVLTWRPIYLAVCASYLACVIVETVRHSQRPWDVPGTGLAILVGNLAPGLGTLGRVVGLLKDRRRIYQND
jgi:cellulose synthase/poly-beta-1,6-N-acetylglucosamine synthase-like glycosyltransferase